MSPSMLVFFIITYVFTGFILAVYAFIATDKEYRSKLTDTFLLIFFLPSIGYGLWDLKNKELKKDRNLQIPAYYIFNKMGVVHALFIPVFFVLLLLNLYVFGDNSFAEFLLGLFFVFVLSVIYFIFFFIALLGLIILPFFIATMIYKKNNLDTDLNESIIDMGEWERTVPPIDKKDLPPFK